MGLGQFLAGQRPHDEADSVEVGGPPLRAMGPKLHALLVIRRVDQDGPALVAVVPHSSPQEVPYASADSTDEDPRRDFKHPTSHMTT